MNYTIITKAFIDDNEDNRAYVYANADVGILEPVRLDGSENQYYIVKGLAYPDAYIAPSIEEEETIPDYITRLRPLTLQAFADLAMSNIPALQLTNAQLKLLTAQPEFNNEEIE
jgi:hypothetical protein